MDLNFGVHNYYVGLGDNLGRDDEAGLLLLPSVHDYVVGLAFCAAPVADGASSPAATPAGPELVPTAAALDAARFLCRRSSPAATPRLPSPPEPFGSLLTRF